MVKEFDGYQEFGEQSEDGVSEAMRTFSGGKSILYGTVLMGTWPYVFVKTHKTLLDKEWTLMYANQKVI